MESENKDEVSHWSRVFPTLLAQEVAKKQQDPYYVNSPLVHVNGVLCASCATVPLCQEVMPRVEGEGKSLTIMGHGEIFNSKKFNTHMILSIPLL